MLGPHVKHGLLRARTWGDVRDESRLGNIGASLEWLKLNVCASLNISNVIVFCGAMRHAHICTP